MTEVATVKKTLSEAENIAAAECTERGKQEARVEAVQKELQALVKKHESLELDSKTQASELAAALKSAKSAKAEAQKALQEIEAMKKIAAGKAFIMQSKHVNVNYLLLTRVRSSPGAFADLPRSASDAAAYYRAEEGSSTEKLFWSQYAEAGHLVPLSYFWLVRRLVDACPRLEVIKRSVCIEGARRAFARAKVHWGKLDAEKLVKDGPPEGKEHHSPEMYYAGECSKDVIFE